MWEHFGEKQKACDDVSEDVGEIGVEKKSRFKWNYFWTYVLDMLEYIDNKLMMCGV